MSKGDPTAAKANKELGEQGHLVREDNKVEREFGHLSEYDLHTNEIFWVSNASLLCNGRHAER